MQWSVCVGVRECVHVHAALPLLVFCPGCNLLQAVLATIFVIYYPIEQNVNSLQKSQALLKKPCTSQTQRRYSILKESHQDLTGTVKMSAIRIKGDILQCAPEMQFEIQIFPHDIFFFCFPLDFRIFHFHG